MSESEEKPAVLQSSAAAEARQGFEETRGLLLRLLTRRYGLSEHEAETLVYETYMLYLQLERAPSDPASWLIAAACQYAATHLRQHGRGLARVAEEAAEGARALGRAELLRDALETLPPRAREALRLRSEQGLTDEEVAAELGISTFAARRILAKAAMQVRGAMKKRERF
jgi:RNA polymerase sigma factor (sigma-70 family)